MNTNHHEPEHPGFRTTSSWTYRRAFSPRYAVSVVRGKNSFTRLSWCDSGFALYFLPKYGIKTW